MMEKKHSTVGSLWAVASNGDYIRTAGGSIEVWHTHNGAEKASEKLGGKAVSLTLVREDYYKPVLSETEDVLALIDSIRPLYEAGIPRTTICTAITDHQYNVLRHRPLGAKKDVQEGDEDHIVEVRIKFYADVFKMLNRQG